MLAVVKSRPEPGIELKDVPQPEVGEAGLLKVRVVACGVCGTDLHYFEWDTSMPLDYFITLPRILGHEFSGVIEEVGPGCGPWKVGDRVVAETGAACGVCNRCRLGLFNHCPHQTRLGSKRDGAMTNYVLVPVRSLYSIPERVSFEEAALFEPIGVAVHALEQSAFKPGDRAMVFGPGAIGLLMAMVLRAGGAGDVVVVGLEVDAERLRLAEGLGAFTVNAQKADPVQVSRDRTDGLGMDVVFDFSGSGAALMTAVRAVRAGGNVVEGGLGSAGAFDYNELVFKEVTLTGTLSRQHSSWVRAINLMASGALDVRPLMSGSYGVAEVEKVFHLLRQRCGIKYLLTPG